MKGKIGGLVVVMILGFVVGCGQDAGDEGPPDTEEQETGLALGIDVRTDSDVEGFRFVISECDEGPVVVRDERSLEELSLPGGITEFSKQPFDEDSQHAFADFFQLLPAGCYDVDVEPINAKGSPSSDCDSAHMQEVFVVDGMTTEILLLSQCQGPSVGASDIVAALNNAPVIESVDYSPSKFLYECEEVEICVTASDADGDPLEFEFEQVGGPRLRFDMDVTEPTVAGDEARACLRAVPVFRGNYEFQVRVYDQAWQGGEKLRIEDHIGESSRAELKFPMYTNWDFELECYDPTTEQFHRFHGMRDVQRVSGCEPIWPHQFFCSDFHWDETDRTCPDGEFKPEEVYLLCHDHEGQYSDNGADEPSGAGPSRVR